MSTRALVLSSLAFGACSSGPGQTDSSASSSGAATTAGATAETGAPTTAGPTTTPSNLPPVAEISAEPLLGPPPLTVTFSSEGSGDPDGAIAGYAWDFGDGETATGATVEHVYASVSNYTVTLTVTDDDGAATTAKTLIKVGGCPQYAAGAAQGNIAAPAVLEASGLVASRGSPGVLWTHNDSDPDGPRLYTVTLKGAALGTYTLQGAEVRDWEDLAIGPGPKPGQDYLYVGDIGDNSEKYASVTVYRVPEPPVDAAATGVVASLSGVEALELVYPGGQAHDAETLLVDPQGGDLYVVSKREDGASQVFRAAAPVSAGTTALAEVAQIDFGIGGLATGGSVSAAGDWVVIRTYFGARMWPRAPGSALSDAFAGPGCPVPVVMEIQGEAIAFAADGLDYLTTSEGVAPTLYRYARQ